jgi:Jacalin-like lectin domain
MKSRGLVLSVAWCSALAASALADTGPVGGGGGSAFSLACAPDEKIGAVSVRSGRRIDGVAIHCVPKGAVPKTVVEEQRAGAGGHRADFKILADEVLTRIEGTTGTCNKDSERICSLRFVTSRNRVSGWFGQPGPRQFSLFENGEEIIGFTGRSGREIDQIGVRTRAIADAAGTAAKRVDARAVAVAISKVLGSIDVRLNNIGERHGNSWHREKDSWVRFQDVNFRFTIDEWTYRRSKGIYRYFYYVNDVNLRSGGIDTQFEPGRFVLYANFEDEGREGKGLCRYKKPGGDYAQCPGRNEGDGNTPDVDWVRPRVKVEFVPDVLNGGVVWYAKSVKVEGDFKLNGVCGAGNECKGILGDWEGDLRGNVQESIRALFNGSDFRTRFADAMRRALDTLDVRNVRSAEIQGSDLVLRCAS